MDKVGSCKKKPYNVAMVQANYLNYFLVRFDAACGTAKSKQQGATRALPIPH